MEQIPLTEFAIRQATNTRNKNNQHTKKQQMKNLPCLLLKLGVCKHGFKSSAETMKFCKH